MNCIFKKCKYYKNHMFNESWATCDASSRSFKKNTQIECYIEDDIRAYRLQVKSLERCLVKINKNQIKEE